MFGDFLIALQTPSPKIIYIMLVKRIPTRSKNINFDNFINNVFSDLDKSFTGALADSVQKRHPWVNIIESDDDFKIEMAAPGLTKKDFKIDLENEVLTISTEKKSEEKEIDKINYTRREFDFTNFKRSFSLSETIDSQSIKAKYANGVLIVTLLKKEEAKPQPPRSIKIS